MDVNLLISKESLKDIFLILKGNYDLIAPVYKDGIVTYSQVDGFDQIASGKKDIQSSRYYRIDDSSYFFSISKPVNSLKNFLHPPEFDILTVKKKNGKLEFIYEKPEKKYAFFGVPPCDLNALSVLDDVFINKNDHPDIYYRNIRENIFILSYTCINPVDTCFCTSFGYRPFPEKNFDIAITELEDYFLVNVGSEKGMDLMKNIPHRKAEDKDLKEKERIIRSTEEKIKNRIDTDSLPEILYRKIDSDFWDKFNKTCLACTSCTQVCPTCFCFDIVEENDLVSMSSTRKAVWDSCFNPSFATVHRFNVRESVASRYRQWLMHKFAYWTDQFGTFGCIGCGRCITWCPSGIDIRNEINLLRESDV